MDQKKYYHYAEGVEEGRIVSGILIKKAVKRFYRLLSDARYEFREESADDVIDFCALLRHTQSPHKGKPFEVEAWQAFVIASIYGFYKKENGKRLVTSAYIEVARKNGKTALGAALCLYHFLMDGVHGGQVFLAANSRDQVKLSAWPVCSEFARSLDPKEKTLKIYRDQINCSANKSFMKVLPAEAKRLDGLNPSMWLLDEFHEAPTARVKDVLESGQGQRKNPMGIVITTAGFNLLSPCYELRNSCIRTLEGIIEEDSLFVGIFSLDRGDDWRDEGVWLKANPNLGVTVDKDSLCRDIKSAMNQPAKEVPVKTKNLNIWCSSVTAWMPADAILACMKEVKVSDYEYCYVGIDLAATRDFTAMAALFQGKEGKLYFKVWYYLPQEADIPDRLQPLYGEWVRHKQLIRTPGNVTNYEYVLEDLLRLNQVSRVFTVGYDVWNSTQFVAEAQGAGFKMQKFSQTTSNMNQPTREIERLVLSRQAVIDNNPINLHCFSNVQLFMDHIGNVRPSKSNPEKKIDGVMAMLNALGVYLLTPKYNNEL